MLFALRLIALPTIVADQFLRGFCRNGSTGGPVTLATVAL